MVLLRADWNSHFLLGTTYRERHAHYLVTSCLLHYVVSQRERERVLPIHTMADAAGKNLGWSTGRTSDALVLLILGS